MKRLLFICYNLEPGCDGVGDYCRLLASQLVRTGVEVILLSLEDDLQGPARTAAVDSKWADVLSSFDASKCRNEFQLCDGGAIQALRLHRSLQPEQRHKILLRLLEIYAPDVISLQLSPYGFAANGRPTHLPQILGNLPSRAIRHVMCHELWAGPESFWDFKGYIHTYRQRPVLQSILKTYNPGVLHTNLPESQLKLWKLGWEAKGLPVFANLPPKLLAESGDGKQAGSSFKVGLFSQFEARSELREFLVQLSENCRAANLDLHIIFIGGRRERANVAAAAFAAAISPSPRIDIRGFLNDQELAGALGECDLGLSPVPRHAAGKSGTIAAFLSAGVPVATPFDMAGKAKYSGFFDPELEGARVKIPCPVQIQTGRASIHELRSKISIARVAETFIKDLQ